MQLDYKDIIIKHYAALSERQHGQRKRPYLEQADAFPDTGNDPLPEWFI